MFVFFPEGFLSLMQHFKQVLYDVEFLLSPVQETKETQHPTRPVENVALTTKGLQERNRNIEWDDDGKVGN